MSKAGIIALLGLFSAFLPFLGIPTMTKLVLAVVSGLIIFALALLAREERRWLIRAVKGDHQTDAYTENGREGYGEKVTQAS